MPLPFTHSYPSPAKLANGGEAVFDMRRRSFKEPHQTIAILFPPDVKSAVIISTALWQLPCLQLAVHSPSAFSSALLVWVLPAIMITLSRFSLPVEDWLDEASDWGDLTQLPVKSGGEANAANTHPTSKHGWVTAPQLRVAPPGCAFEGGSSSDNIATALDVLRLKVNRPPLAPCGDSKRISLENVVQSCWPGSNRNRKN
ncbi:uncharacterized protein E0L32_002326 [Thyridium curvatum]|uniref:Uncharacterized protein n=1 Tax=Thyridium curvatum TaxID=1093900 RepID=A0A507ARM8_9PEZI|nr:uncharacterized protein E0L32_002326 [Thyridium curvatum]TPX06830.1 hypothetical protein E0L32_002326 [Thyridium curvatum]